MKDLFGDKIIIPYGFVYICEECFSATIAQHSAGKKFLLLLPSSRGDGWGAEGQVVFENKIHKHIKIASLRTQ
jgi:hypothetical protein